MHSITPYHSITSDRTDLDMGGINYSTLQSTHLKTFRQESADFTIVTAEGDKVMFSSSSQFQATYVTYDSFARTKGEFTLFQGESFDLNTNRELVISVDGDLNRQELKDIKKALRTIGKIMKGFLSGDIGNSAAKAMKIGKLESISSLEASLQLEQNISLDQQLVTETTPSLSKVADAIMPKDDMTVLEHINNLTDKMTDVVKDSRVKPAKLVRPIHKLFSHLFKGLSRDNPPDSPRLAIAKLIKSNLLNRIEHLSETEEDKGTEQKS
jgi:hypothetical protein